MDACRINAHDLNFVDGNGHLSIVMYLGGCNLSCPYCFNKDLIKEEPEYSFTDIRNMYGHVQNPGYVFSGGEPTISPHFIPLFEMCKDSLITIHTNGLYIPFVDYKCIDQVVISLKGSKDIPYTYDTYLKKLQNALQFYEDCKYKELRSVNIECNLEDYAYALSFLSDKMEGYNYVSVEDSRK